MPNELKQLGDYYHPPTASDALQFVQQQRQLGLQQQQVEQQKNNLEIDNLQNALKTADPMQSYPLQKQINDRLGVPTLPVNEYYAALPYTKQLRGAQKMNVAAGMGGDMDVAALTEAKGPVQAQVANAVAMSPLQQEQQQLVHDKNVAHAAVVAELQPQIQTFNTFIASTKLGVETHAPMVAQLQAMETQFQRTKQQRGMPTAEEEKAARLAGNPKLAKFQAEMKAAIDPTEQGLAKVQKDQSDLSARLNNIAMGAGTLEEGESIERLTGQLNAYGTTSNYLTAALAFQRAPTPANLQAMQHLGLSMKAELNELVNKKTLSAQGRLEETIRKNLYDEGRVNRIGQAQTAWQASGGNLKTAYKYAQQFGVKVNEVTEAAKDPTKAGVEVNLYDKKQSIAEAGQLANVNQSISEIQDARKVYVKPDGSIDRVAVLTGSLGLPFTDGRSADIGIRKAVEVKLRAATGASAPQAEVKNYLKLFAPNNLDSDELIKYKLDSFENWMQTVADTTDPLGSLRQRSNELMSEGTVGELSSPEFKFLRNKFPQQSTRDIMGFLKKHKMEK